MSSPRPGQVRIYIGVFLTLIGLTVATVVAASTDFGHFNTPIALAIAALKATLVILYFMHVKDSTRLTKVFAAAGFFWILILFALTFSDFATRSPVSFPGP